MNLHLAELANLLLREAKVALPQVEQNGLDSLAEPPLDFVLGQVGPQPEQVCGHRPAQTSQHKRSQQFVLHIENGAVNVSVMRGTRGSEVA